MMFLMLVKSEIKINTQIKKVKNKQLFHNFANEIDNGFNPYNVKNRLNFSTANSGLITFSKSKHFSSIKREFNVCDLNLDHKLEKKNLKLFQSLILVIVLNFC